MSEKLLLVAASLGAMVLATAACEITTGEGGTGGHAGHHAGGHDHGGTGGTSTGAGATGGSSADGGAGGEAACVLCSAALGACNTDGCLDEPNYCEGSEALFSGVYACACAADVCGAECAETCTGEGVDDDTCTACLQTAITQTANADGGCKEEGTDCINDM